MRISDWSSDVFSSDLSLSCSSFSCGDGSLDTNRHRVPVELVLARNADSTPAPSSAAIDQVPAAVCRLHWCHSAPPARISENSNPCSSSPRASIVIDWTVPSRSPSRWRSEEHTSELQSLMRISYAVFFLKKKI